MSQSKYTTLSHSGKIKDADLPAVVQRLRDAFHAGVTRSYEWRLQQLKQLYKMLDENRRLIIDAVRADLGKQSDMEINSSEINAPLVEIEEAIAHLADWMKPESAGMNLASFPATNWIYKDPLGVVLVVAPWNFPVNLAVVPLMGAIAAGNCAFLKLSRHSSQTAKTLEKLVLEYLDMRAIAVEGDGGAAFITSLLKEKYDHIFFTGSVAVGKIVYEAAAKHLTPVTLELGGKNPCYVDRDVDVRLVAKRLAWAKFFNCGQVCITADYVLAHTDIHDQLVEALKLQIREFFGSDPKKSESYARIISKDHAKRLSDLFKMGNVECGGEADVEERYVAPTVITNPKLDSLLMQDEIFGPVLPIVKVDSHEAAIQFVKDRPLPLALYVHTRNSQVEKDVLARTRSGAAGVNDHIVHFLNSELPFGGVGESGLGAYHGKLSFETFVHRRAVVKQSTWFDIPLRYAPYSNGRARIVNFVTSGMAGKVLTRLGYVLAGAALAVVLQKNQEQVQQVVDMLRSHLPM
eukprot:TRINITY_DN1377_c0_g1_i1.p1 TRINITY_DN1377_c0_g1~~TRINITY_DN1377_c0_g1_i1.p1  ORF type:complete len:519 (-),score=124.33 TRINITY_DN1377_c0_g1_i1:8-1564(-)